MSVAAIWNKFFLFMGALNKNWTGRINSKNCSLEDLFLLSDIHEFLCNITTQHELKCEQYHCIDFVVFKCYWHNMKSL